MTDKLEAEQIAELENFHMEIKGIVEKIKQKDANSKSITDVNELEADDDMVNWKQFQDILVRIEELDFRGDEDTLKKTLQALCDASFELDQQVQASVKKARDKNKESKKYFCAWLNNKNPLPKLRNALRRFDERGKTLAVQNLQAGLKNLIDLCVKGGWRNQEIEA